MHDDSTQAASWDEQPSTPQGGQQRPPQQPQWGQPLQTQPPGNSRRLLWIVLAVVVILGIVGGVFLSLSFSGSRSSSSAQSTVVATAQSTVVTATGAESIATQYYQAIQQQDYQKAYSFLNVSTLKVQGQNVPATEQLYMQLASGADAARGKVSSSALKSTSTSNGATSITVTATRNGNPYEVHLTLQQSGADWKIVFFDQI